MSIAQSKMVTFDPMRARTDDKSLENLVPEEHDIFTPPFPQKAEDLGVPLRFLLDLTLKVVSTEGDCTTANVASQLGVGFVIADELLQQLNREKLLEIKGVVGLHNHRYGILDRGWESINQLIRHNSYIGPVPVSLKNYTAMMTHQTRARKAIAQHLLDKALDSLVLSAAAKQTLGLIASSGRSLFLSGPSGNGKTAMARAIVNAIPGHIWIPYAIEVDGQVIQVFDPHSHRLIVHDTENYDRRWLKISPPLIVVGGELTIENLDLTSHKSPGYYEAPIQMKANGGVLVVDDLGRQRCSATDLLNRWIIPLEHRFDYLTLNTGKKIQVPFDQVLIFATNLTISDIADEAFLRRMGYRLYVMPPSPETYAEIFNRYAATHGLSVAPEVLAYLDQRYGKERREPKACEPRDLIDRAVEICRYRREPIRLTKETVDLAWNGYFGASASG